MQFSRKVRMLLPQWSQGNTLKNHMPFIAHSTTIASQANPVGPVYMATTSCSQKASSNRQAMTIQSKPQKALYVPPRNRKLTIPPTQAIKLKLLLVCAKQHPESLNRGRTWTVQTARSFTLQACSQSLYITVHIYQGHHITYARHQILKTH